MTDVFVYSWALHDTYKYTQIRCYGIDGTGQTVALIISDFTPYVYIELPQTHEWHMVRDLVLSDLVDKTLCVKVIDKDHLYSAKGTGKFIFCQCSSRKQIAAISFMLKQQKYGGYKLQMHEENASPILQLTSLRNIPTATWISVNNCEAVKERQTLCDVELKVSWKNLNRSKETKQVHPKIMAFDLEVNSEVMNAMPSNKPNDVIFQISCVTFDNVKRKILLTFDGSDLPSDQLDGIDVRVFENEEDLLGGFITLLREERPNVLTGYNILMFDIAYMIARCERYGMMEELQLAGYNFVHPAQYNSIKWSSSAYKNQEYKFIDWEGILILDLLPLIKRDYKFDNYKLDTVASELIGAEKDPVDYKEIFSSFRCRKMARVGKYCVQDSNLCVDLLNHIHCWISLSEMAAVCKVSMFALYTQGQQLKIYNQVYDYCLRKNIIVTSNGYECKSGERYLGAYVMDPVPGFYENIVPLDFASLYPSIIIAYNICYSTFVSESDVEKIPETDYQVFEWEDHLGCEHDPKIVEITELSKQIEAIEMKIKKHVEMRDSAKGQSAKKSYQLKINALRVDQKPMRERRSELKKGRPSDREDFDGNIVSGIVCSKRLYRFMKREVKPGIVPTIIQNLLNSRKLTKNEMKKCDPVDVIVYDKKQLAYKVSANSMYGAMGMRKGMLPFMPGAMCVTYIGRESIAKAGNIVCSKYGGEWIYTDTDSTYVRFPFLKTPQEIWDYSIDVASKVSSEFPGLTIEFEQAIYTKFIILSKKRYMYRACNREGTCDGKLGKRGVVIARRDNAKLVRIIYAETVDMIFNGWSTEQIEERLIEYISDIFRKRIPYDNYVATKSIGSISGGGDDDDNERIGTYKVKKLPRDEVARAKTLNGKSEREWMVESCPPQVQLAERMRNRGCPVDAGSRMEYVVLDVPGFNKTLGKRMEDYDYFVKNRNRKNLRIDNLYYLKSMINPLDQLLEVVGLVKFTETQYEYRSRFENTQKELRKLFAPVLVYH